MYKLLDGVRVIELGHMMMAPYATQMLGDMGADVIKVESPEGDFYRRLGLAREPNMTAQWMAVNRNKRSIAIDLKEQDGRDALLHMVQKADVVVHNMRPKAIERLGMDYDSVRARNPRIVYCAAMGFGQDGPYADYPAFDDIIQAYSGLADANGRSVGEPRFVPVAIADMIVGLMLGQAMLAGLHRQRATGQGAYLETPMFEAMVSVVLNQHLSGHAFRPPAGSLGNERVMNPFRKPARTKDGYIVHGLLTYDHWRRFLAAVQLDDVLSGPMMRDSGAMAQNISALYELAATEILPTRTSSEWRALLDTLDIASAPVRQIEDLESDPHLKAVGLFQDYEHPTSGSMRHVRLPFGVRDVEQADDRHPPTLGEHGVEVLRDLGFEEDHIARLEAMGVLGVAGANAPRS